MLCISLGLIAWLATCLYSSPLHDGLVWVLDVPPKTKSQEEFLLVVFAVIVEVVKQYMGQLKEEFNIKL